MKIERYRVRDRTRRFVFLGCTGLVSAGCRGANSRLAPGPLEQHFAIFAGCRWGKLRARCPIAPLWGKGGRTGIQEAAGGAQTLVNRDDIGSLCTFAGAPQLGRSLQFDTRLRNS